MQKSHIKMIIIGIVLIGTFSYFGPKLEKWTEKNRANRVAQEEVEKVIEENRRIRLVNSPEGQWISETLDTIVNKLDSNKLDELLLYLPDNELIRHGGITWSEPGLTRLELIAEIRIKERNHYLRKPKFLNLVKDNIGTKLIDLHIYEDSVIITDKPYETFDRKEGRVRTHLSNSWEFHFHRKNSQLFLTQVTYRI